MLEVVEHDEPWIAVEHPRHVLEQGQVGIVLDAERSSDRRQHESGIRERRQVDEDVRAAVLRGSGAGEHGLPGPASTCERDQPHVGSAEKRLDRSQLELASDERRRVAPRQVQPVVGRSEGRVVLEDPALQRSQRRRGLEPELVQGSAGFSVRRECVGLSIRAVEREHVQRAQPLAMRMVDDEGLELCHQTRVATCVEVPVDSCLERGEPTLVESDRLGAGERLICKVREGGAAPERQSLAQRVPVASVHQLPEQLEVELVRIDSNEVAGRPGDDPIRAERFAQCVHVDL